MSTKQLAKEIIDFPVKKLKTHPLQKTIYQERTDWQIEELAQSMAQRQDEPVEILPDGTLIAGHGRAEAAKRLEWQTIKAWVRYDLAEAGPEAVASRLIETNLVRRHLTRLDMARSYRYLARLARDNKGRQVRESQAAEKLRALITKRFRVSKKTLSRWLHVLDLPIVLQQAVDEGRLPLTLAVRVASLKATERTQIAQRIQDGAAPPKVVAEYFAPRDNRHRHPNDAFVSFLRRVRPALDDLDGRVESVSTALVEKQRPDLERTRDVIDKLLARANGKPRGRQRCDEEE